MARPFFAAAWAAAQQIYDPVDSAGRVATVIGGYIEKNINNPDPSQRWENTCAVRMSYILNYSGLIIPKTPGQTVSGNDQRQYFFRVKNLISFLETQWGKPDVVKYPPSGGGALANKRGVILFEITGWQDASGHATLYDGNICYDHCYFNEPGVNYSTEKANFWSLS
ncbi:MULTISPECIES: type VI secretion system amidase effector protein Tae4 [Pseudomonas syringae group]|uniref:type VI secretion system amidase effector protein Tae4 n=1 Tax=Pseudomonas syringae group TaxID=136849 RepID=UPI0006E5546D|nr:MULTISPECIES: type VI secretion system amidase effector protein Tae4 [Pseudomonas syringae group]KPX69061.1 putative cytoplasmic protein [Pseudomonas syringae pv. maculicola]QQN27164.1 type VI secretion system amidase effector protein Tae4 [Pseudomonas syringae pv. maculicola]RMM04508.1 putative cytoplasmic protein [Pseudomonas syringae]RMO88033.1 putative cytoplasmic protein [Pseudomonas syringae pv. maculicola]